jgi:hypothetical protein
MRGRASRPGGSSHVALDRPADPQAAAATAAEQSVAMIAMRFIEGRRPLLTMLAGAGVILVVMAVPWLARLLL